MYKHCMIYGSVWSYWETCWVPIESNSLILSDSCVLIFKGLVHPTFETLSSFTCTRVVPTTYDLLSIIELFHNILNTQSNNKKWNVRIINVEQPVETHVHAERHVDQAAVLLLQTVVDAGQTVDHLHDVHELLILFQIVLLKGLTGRRHAQKIHCVQKNAKFDKVLW